MREDYTLIRRIVEQINQATAGKTVYRIKFTADYKLNTRFTAQFFFDMDLNQPIIQSSYASRNIYSGISLKFTLAPAAKK